VNRTTKSLKRNATSNGASNENGTVQTPLSTQMKDERANGDERRTSRARNATNTHRNNEGRQHVQWREKKSESEKAG